METGPSERGSSQVIKFHVIFTPSDELQALRGEVEALKAQLADLQAQQNRLDLLYRSECLINMELQDLLRENKIPYRDAIKQYRGMV